MSWFPTEQLLENNQQDQNRHDSYWPLPLTATVTLQVGKQTAGWGGLKKCQSHLHRCLTAPAALPPLWAHHHVHWCQDSPACSPQMPRMVQPHCCLMWNFLSRWLGWGLSHRPVQSFLRIAPCLPHPSSFLHSFHRCQTSIVVWGSPYLLMFPPCILHKHFPQ